MSKKPIFPVNVEYIAGQISGLKQYAKENSLEDMWLIHIYEDDMPKDDWYFYKTIQKCLLKGWRVKVLNMTLNENLSGAKVHEWISLDPCDGLQEFLNSRRLH